jgi:hypothetical protein
VTATPAQDDDGDPLTDHQLALASAGAGGLALVLALLAMVRSSRRRV